MLEIRKITNKVWKHINDVDGEFILSKFYVKSEFSKFLIVEVYGSKRREFAINEIEVYDVGGSAETFASFTLLFQRLEELNYPAFYEDGVIVPNTLISTDTPNLLELGSDSNLFVEDAPSDGSEYVRKNGSWEVATGGGGSGTDMLVYSGLVNLSSSAYTGTTAEMYLGNVMLPADTCDTSTFYRVEILSNIYLDTLSGNIRVYLGTSAGSLTDLILTQYGYSAQRFMNNIRTSGTINNTTFEIVNGNWSSQFDLTNANQIMQTKTIDLTNDIYFNISFEANDISSTIYPKFLHVKIYKNG